MADNTKPFFWQVSTFWQASDILQALKLLTSLKTLASLKLVIRFKPLTSLKLLASLNLLASLKLQNTVMTMTFIFMVNMHKTTTNELQVLVEWLRLLMSKYKLIMTCILMWHRYQSLPVRYQSLPVKYQSLPVSLLLLCGLSSLINFGSHDIAESDVKHQINLTH